MKFYLPCLLLALAACQTHAQINVTNLFNGEMSFAGQTNATVLSTNISQTPFNFTVEGQLEKWTGVASSSAADRFMASQWSTSSLDSSKYFEFSLSVAPTGVPFAYFDSMEVDFALRRSSSGPRQFQWRSSLDGFSTAITNFTLVNPSIMLSAGVLTLPDTSSTETFAGNRFMLSGPSLLNATNVTMRLYGYQAESSLGQGGLDTPLAFSGEVVVPEPSTYALLTLAAAAGAWIKLRRRR